MRRHRSNLSRPGVTLIEVLVAIFVMAIGLMALLTLFPLGALNMAQSIKDDRSATAAANAAAIARTAWRLGAANANPPGSAPDSDIDDAMRRPGGPLPQRTAPNMPSYPAYVDAFGWLQYSGNWQTWIAGTPGSMRRCTQKVIRTQPAPYWGPLSVALFSVRDDLIFDDNAVAGYNSSVQNEGLYSWAYVVQLPDASEPQLADLRVVVYRRRSLQFGPDAVPTGETLYRGDFSGGSKVVTVSYNPATQDKPAIRAGGWVVDCTMTNPANVNDLTWIPRAHFYRVVSVTETSGTTIELELQTEARATSIPGQLAVLDNVVEVFDKGSLTP